MIRSIAEFSRLAVGCVEQFLAATDQRDVFQWIAVNEQDIGIGTFFESHRADLRDKGSGRP